MPLIFIRAHHSHIERLVDGLDHSRMGMSEQSSPKGRTQIDIFPAIEIENLAALCAGDIKRAIGGSVYPR
jgi:hypothetical protein